MSNAKILFKDAMNIAVYGYAFLRFMGWALEAMGVA